MPQIVAYDDVKAGEEHHYLSNGAERWRTNFMIPEVKGVPHRPLAFLAKGTPRRVIKPHFHCVDQFQVVVYGDGVIGKHKLAPYGVHFTRANTPYGPIVGGEQGLAFLTLRSMGDPTGRHRFPQAREELKNMRNREPWQVTEVATFGEDGEVSLRQLSKVKDDRGLAAFSLKLKPGAKTSAPDPSQSDGQYVIITNGSLRHEGREHKAITIAFVKPGENALQLEAGADGLEALVLNFPRRTATKPSLALKGDADKQYRVWQCQLCAVIYDEAKGLPDEGIAPGTRWEDVPENWTCPDCSASKADFDMQVIA